MNPREFHQQVMKLVGAVLECAPDQRAAFLDEHCGADQRLRDEVESLLDFEEDTAAFSGTPIISLRPDDSQEPRQVGPYEILRRLGTGGMGDVYLARQEKPFRRQVALKLIHRSMHRHDVVRRFQVERNILANLEHPNIARLLDGGADEDGRPYFAMEYVDGQPIDEYCDHARLPIHRRLELFRKVCSAVQLSHQNLVVHRDLKPGNILVDATGEPKLLDFGIAKLLQGEPSGVTAFATSPGRHPMTQAYASPEMVAGEGITTVSDIYSLGIVLYRLLCGRHPYRIHGCSSAEIDRTIRDEEPKRPSTVMARTKQLRSSDGIVYELTPEAVSERRGSDPVKLKRQLSGDLDCIVLKALRKEPQERYGSVVELSEDIRRYLEGLPVAARADTFRYRTGKFVRRHRWGLATAAAFLLLIVGFSGTVTVLWQQTLETLADLGEMRMSTVVLVEALESTDPQNEEENLTSVEIVQRGVDLYDESFKGELEVQANVFDNLGLIYTSRGHFKSARPLLEESLQIRKNTLEGNHLLVAESLLNLAQLLGLTGEFQMAEKMSGDGLAILRRHYREPNRLLARAISNHGTQAFNLRKYEQAEVLYLEALKMKKALYGDHHLEVATSLATLGSLCRLRGDLESARQRHWQALEIRQALLPPKHPKLGSSYNHVGTILYEQGDYVEAEPILRQALEIRREVLGVQHPEVATTVYRLALVVQKLGQYDRAEPLFRQAQNIRCTVFGDEHLNCASVKSSLAKLLVARGEPEVAEALALEALDVFMNQGATLRIAVANIVLGESLAARRRYEKAEALMLESYSTLYEARGEESVVTADARLALLRLYEAWERPEKARDYRK